jgi:hypothetical protein
MVHVELPVVSLKMCREETMEVTFEFTLSSILSGMKYCAGYGQSTPPSGLILPSILSSKL